MVEEEASFVGDPGEAVYQVIHRPVEQEAVGGVLICSSLHAEQLSNYRAEVMLARALARKGLSVLRFHYRGTGHSSGDSEGLNHDQMVTDAVAAAGRLRTLTHGRLVAYGARWGAVVAAAAVNPREPVAAWQPVLDGRRYWREVSRFESIHRMREGAQALPSLSDRLSRDGYFDVLGYRIHDGLYRSMLDTGPHELLRGRGRHLLLVQMSGRAELDRRYQALSDDVQTSGGTFEARFFAEEPVWWLLRPPVGGLDSLVEATADWLVDRVRGS